MRRICIVLIILLTSIICRGDNVPVAPQVTIAGSEGLINEPNGQIIIIVTIEGEFNETSWSCNQTYGTITEIIKDELYLYQSYTNACTTEQIVSENFTFTAINHPEDYPNSQLPSSSASATVTIYTMDILPPTISKCENITNLTGMYNTRAHKVTLIDKNHVPWLFYCAYNYQNGKYSMNAVYFNDAEWTCSFSLEEPAGHFYTPHDAISIENNNQKYIYLLYLDDSLNSRTWKIVKLDISDDCLPYLSDWSNEALPSITELNSNMVYDLLYDGQTFYIGGSDGNNIYYRKFEGNQWTNPTLVASDIGDETRLKWTPATNGQIWASFTRYHWSYRNIWGRPYENGEWLEPGSQYEEQWTNNSQYYPASYASAMISDSMNYVWTAFRESLGPSYYPQHIKAQLIRKNIADTGHEHISLSNNNEGESYYIDPALAYNKGKNDIFGFYARYITTDIPAPSPDIVSGEILMKTVPCNAEASIWDTAPYYRITASSLSKSDTISVSEEFSPYGLICVNKRQMFSGGSYLSNLVVYRHKADISFPDLTDSIPDVHSQNIRVSFTLADEENAFVSVWGDVANPINKMPINQLNSLTPLGTGSNKVIKFQFSDQHDNMSPVYEKTFNFIRDDATNLFASHLDNLNGLEVSPASGNPEYGIRAGRLMCKLKGHSQVRCRIPNSLIGLTDNMPYRLGFDMRAVTEDRVTPNNFDVIIQFNKQQVWEQYRIQTENSFQGVELLRLKDYLGGNPNPGPLAPTGTAKFRKMSDPNPALIPTPTPAPLDNWVANNIDWCRWHRVEATINPVGNQTYIHLYVDGRLLQEWTDESPSTWSDIESFDIIVGDNNGEFTTNIKCVDIDNIVMDNAFASSGRVTGVVSDKYQTFVNMDNITDVTSPAVVLENGEIKFHDFGAMMETMEVIKPANLHDYNLNLTLRYDSVNLGHQEIWLRRNWSDYNTNYLTGQDSDYNFEHEYAYILSTEDGFNTVSLEKRLINGTQNNSTNVGYFPLNGLQMLPYPPGMLSTSGPTDLMRLRFSIHGSMLDVYKNGMLACSLMDDLSPAPIHFGSTMIKSTGAEVAIKDFSIDTDYYFWSRKGNRFMYRAEEAVPVGFNTFPYKYTYCRDLFDYLTEGSPEVLDDLRIRMDKANEAGARVLRMVMVAGWADLGNWAPVDVPFAVHNTIKVAKEVAGNNDTKSGKITYEAFADFMREVVAMARERDLVILPALRYGPTPVWDLMLSGNPYNWDEEQEQGQSGSVIDYLYVGNDGDVNTFVPTPHHLVDRIYEIIEPFTDETAILGWEYFNEAAGIQWIWKDVNNDGYIDDPSPNDPDNWGERRSFRAGSFFTECTKIITDEKINNSIETGSMSDKHIISSGMWHFDYTGEHYEQVLPKSVTRVGIMYQHTIHNLLNDAVFCRYNDFIDWHSYGFDANQCYPYAPTDPDFRSCLSWHLEDYTKLETGYQDNYSPPIMFGEINPLDPKDYAPPKMLANQVVYRFAGFERTLLNTYNAIRKFSWYEVSQIDPIFSLTWDNNDTNPIYPIQVQSIDIVPSYLRSNEHYRIWKDWFDGISTLGYPSNRKCGFLLWHLTNTDQTLPSGQYDPASRNTSQEIDGYNPTCNLTWHDIYLNNDNIYFFYLNLFKKDWGIK